MAKQLPIIAYKCKKFKVKEGEDFNHRNILRYFED
jgi:hypothetical protein